MFSLWHCSELETTSAVWTIWQGKGEVREKSWTWLQAAWEQLKSAAKYNKIHVVQGWGLDNSTKHKHNPQALRLLSLQSQECTDECILGNLKILKSCRRKKSAFWTENQHSVAGLFPDLYQTDSVHGSDKIRQPKRKKWTLKVQLHSKSVEGVKN